MSTDKNTIIAFILIGLILMLFTWLNRPDQSQIEAQQRYRDSLAKVEYARQLETAQQTVQPTVSSEAQRLLAYGVFAQAVEGKEEVVTLENNQLELKFGSRGGCLLSARLKEFVTFDGQPLILFDGQAETSFSLALVSAANRVVNTGELYFTPLRSPDGRSLVMRLPIGEEGYLDFKYTLNADDYMLHFTIQGTGLNGILSPNINSLDINWQQKARPLEQGRKYENQYTGLYYKYAADDVESLSAGKNDEKQISNRLKWIGYKNKFFSTALIADDSFFATRLQSKQLDDHSEYLKEFTATTSIAFNPAGNDTVSFRYFIGPNRYNLLRAYDKGIPSDRRLELDNLVPLGYKLFRPVNKYFIIPIFDFLLELRFDYLPVDAGGEYHSLPPVLQVIHVIGQDARPAASGGRNQRQIPETGAGNGSPEGNDGSVQPGGSQSHERMPADVVETAGVACLVSVIPHIV